VRAIRLSLEPVDEVLQVGRRNSGALFSPQLLAQRVELGDDF
jgi:hypothetical protein